LQAILLSYAFATFLFALLTPFTNLSLHAAGVSGAAVCLAYVFGPWGAIAALLVPPVWWARRVLNRHTPLELATGVLVGGGGTWIAFWLIG
jgi:membrane-associated phospholipid phosphatase